MAKPQSRRELREHCLRTLGKPVIDINVDEDQLEDRIDDALQYFSEYHFDGVEKTWLKHEVTETDKTNNYITISNSNTIGIIKLSIIFIIFPYLETFNKI